jgi:hypothetical protein
VPKLRTILFNEELKMTVVYKSKAEIRAETEKQLKAFLKRGGHVQVIETKKKVPAAARTWMKK